MVLNFAYHLIYRRLLTRFEWATLQRHEDRIWEAIRARVRRQRRRHDHA